jgi:diacylglycerol kinase family enzyme
MTGELGEGVIGDPAAAAGRSLRVKVLINRRGRAVERIGPRVLRLQLESAFRSCGVDAEISLVEGHEIVANAEHAVQAAREGRLDRLVIGGGDGTVGSVAGVLADSGLVLGVLPLGTLNHFAKDLGMPLELEEAVRALASAPVRRIDVGEVNGIVFVNNSVLGVYPYMVADRERRRRLHGLDKWVAMGFAFLRMVARFPRRRLTLRIGGEAWRYRTPCLFVGVNEYHIEMLELRRRAGMDGGKLWLFIAKHRHPLPFLWFALRSAFGGLNEEGDFDLLQSAEAVVETRASRVPVSHDGEVTRMPGPFRYRIRPGALRVLAPSPAAAPSEDAAGMVERQPPTPPSRARPGEEFAQRVSGTGSPSGRTPGPEGSRR